MAPLMIPLVAQRERGFFLTNRGTTVVTRLILNARLPRNLGSGAVHEGQWLSLSRVLIAEQQ
jgi:hypothetical protein